MDQALFKRDDGKLRLMIWQDILRDLNNENRYFKGFGYNEIIPAMDLVHRRGQMELMRIQFFILYFSSGWSLQLILFSLFFIKIISIYYKKSDLLY